MLGLVLALLLVGPLATGAVRTQDFLALQAGTTGLIALWLARLALGLRFNLLLPPLTWFVLAFAALAVGRYFTADIEYVARQELLRLLLYAVVFLVVLTQLHKQEHVTVIAVTLLGLGAAEAMYALYQYLSGSTRVWHFIKPYLHRGSGTYISPNNLAGLLELLLPLGLAYLLVGRFRPVTKVLVGYATVMIAAGIAVSISRGSWLATGLTVVVLCLLLIRYPGYRVQAMVMLLAVVAAGAAFASRSVHLQQRFKDMPLTQDIELTSRYEIWGATWRMWRDAPWLGVGPGHFDYRFREYRPDRVQRRPDRAHNDYLNTLADWGVAGGVIVLGGLFALGAGVARTWEHVRKGKKEFGNPLTNKFAFVLGAALGLLALAIHSLVDFNMHIPGNALVAVTLAALLTSHLRFATERYWLEAGALSRALLAAGLVAVLGVFVATGWRQGREQRWLARAQAAPERPAAALQALQNAFAVEPRNPATAFDAGELLRKAAWQGHSDADELALKALEWFRRAIALNPHDARAWLNAGMCLDWVGRAAESAPFYERANQLDPAGYHTLAHIGWHYVQLGNYAAAKPWFERSRRLFPEDNPIADSYLKIIEERLAQGAAAQRRGGME